MISSSGTRTCNLSLILSLGISAFTDSRLNSIGLTLSHPHSDVAPVNAFPRMTSPNGDASQWVFDIAAKDWKKWIGHKAAEQVRTMSGCYSRVHPGTDLKIISINTNYWCVESSISTRRLAATD